ncbi:MAG: hypothetical protein V7609_822 [Verrucomicrobiota bacterium]
MQIIPHAGFRIVALIACASTFLAVSSIATPVEEIAGAVAASGSVDGSQTQSKPFLRAFNAVALRAPARELPAYVSAAIELRPNLSGKIVAVAVKAAIKHWETRPGILCQIIERIVTAAIAANPRAAVSIAQAAVAASPDLRTCVVEAAISAAPERAAAIQSATEFRGAAFGFLTFSEKLETGFVFSAATLSPANISDLRGDQTVNSPEQPPIP